MNPRRTFLPATVSLCILLAFCPEAGGAPEVKGLANPFFAMETGTKDEKHQTFEAQADMLKELGYAGMDHLGLQGIPEKLKVLDARGQGFFAVYTGINIDTDGGAQRYDPSLEAVLRQLKGRETIIWLHALSKKHKPSSVDGDARAVEILREVADMAAEQGLRVALYPHTGFWLETVDDAVRLAKKAERKNLGVTFNLCHSLKVDGEKGMRARIERALPHLFLVTINGADPGGPTWKELIQTLDRGSFDNHRLLSMLKGLGYDGPIGLQGYGIGGDVHDNLKRSMGAWRKISAGIADEWIDLLTDGDLSAWQDPTGEWLVAGRVFKDPKNERLLAWEPASQPRRAAIVNGKTGRTRNILTKLQHGDVQAHIEFMVPVGSNSGVYFQGRYEIQVLDSWGVKEPKYSDCGGVYERWAGGKGYEGRPPRVNASRPPGEWQSFDVIFRAPRWDASGKKIADALFVKVLHNGVLVHENQEVTGPTRAATFNDEKPRGPLMLQGDHGPVAYRNIWLRPLDDTGFGGDGPGAGR